MSEILHEEIQLPPRETWEAGAVQAVTQAETFVRGYDKNKKVLTIEDRQAGIPTVEEVKLSIGTLVMKRMLVEAQADLMHNTIAVAHARRSIMSHPLLPAAHKQSLAEKLGNKEGCGVKLANGWRVIEAGLKMWQNPDFWKHRDPVKEARKLFFAIHGLQEVSTEAARQAPRAVQDVPEGHPQDQVGEIPVEGRSGEVLEREGVPEVRPQGQAEEQKEEGDKTETRS